MASRLPPEWTARMALPMIAAPMFLVSGPDLVIAACKAGVIGAFPAPNCRTIEDLDSWLARITGALGSKDAPFALNMVVHSTYPRLAAELELVKKYKPALVITALGSPRHVVEAVHSYGGRVFADVISPKFAKKAIEAGVDGLILVAAGAGGHAGALAPFAFLPEVRRFWSGPVVLGGAVSNGRAIRAVEVLGADLAYVGTSFIAAVESTAPAAYKDMIVRTDAEGIVLTNAVTGVHGNFLAESLVAAGYDLKNLQPKTMNLSAGAETAMKAWKHIWSAGQGVGNVGAVEPAAEIIARLAREYATAVAEGRRASPWLEKTAAAERAATRDAAE
jgi:nitronate monooxygenase